MSSDTAQPNRLCYNKGKVIIRNGFIDIYQKNHCRGESEFVAGIGVPSYHSAIELIVFYVIIN